MERTKSGLYVGQVGITDGRKNVTFRRNELKEVVVDLRKALQVEVTLFVESEGSLVRHKFSFTQLFGAALMLWHLFDFLTPVPGRLENHPPVVYLQQLGGRYEGLDRGEGKDPFGVPCKEKK